MQINRRDFVKLTGVSLGLGLGLANASLSAFARATKPPIGRVVIIGGGYAGATAAKYLRLWSLGAIEVIVVEAHQQFVSCPLSNLVLGGSKSINDLTFGYDALKANHGIQWVHDTVTAVDPDAKKITMLRGDLSYDRLIVAPGVDFIYDDLPMLASAEAQQQIPHAWKAGWQTVNLRKQLEAMPEGGVFVMNVPKAPYRCPPGPYERVCQVASYLKAHKPRSKIIVLDANAEIISKKGLFIKAWANLYPGIVDYRPDSTVTNVDVATKTVTTDFDKVSADVLNIIPPQQAGKIAKIANLTEKDYPWCEANFLTYESKLVKNVHVLGDSVAAGLPKSAHMATNQAKVCANAIVQLMAGLAPDSAPVFANTCYSFVTDKTAMHVANVYRYDAAKKIMISAEGGGVSSAPSDKEGEYAASWAQNIWTDVLT
ncbi:MAG: NAD(P)/FAD-dependent oxidoreductase [Methylotenera sp.]|nr:NAD(P)/FAD-dependent oxidoreductase [Methylotenera sp.]MDO9233166.1 NAD(P)/FAD-dependent oxidoreductase [Methylotenera sp.]MDO9388279.1 NAD(P)/FAD-dependent oxidoreductase [Methylotenera sp.]MDP2404123.1 NAD(P)/FAD-dependent oxidoreductase [Methylotenera sp.]MDP3094323.1 NAD(P)/FAD-dependent oxidoreductase [Methylotenera sp.]